MAAGAESGARELLRRTAQRRGRALNALAQTAWALLALMAVGAVDDPAVTRGIQHLLDTQKDGTWDEDYYTAWVPACVLFKLSRL